MGMLPKADRAVFTVVAHEGGWAVEHEGEYLDRSSRREDAVACASRRARAAFALGRLVQLL
jgi:hypothetical protein